MFTAYITRNTRPPQQIGQYEVLGERLTPKIALALARYKTFKTCDVYQENVQLRDRTYGTVGYTVYKSGRTRRWEVPLEMVPAGVDDLPF